jgi:hypothetical protein
MDNDKLKEEKDFLLKFKNDIDEVIDLIKKDDGENARNLFNEKIFIEYFKSEFLEGVLKPFRAFFYDLDEYFNNDRYKTFMGYTDDEYKNFIVSTYNKEFLLDFNNIKNKQ